MAEIFNSRDLTLQATVPRLTVTAAIIESTATTFAKPRNVSTITPGSIDLTTIKTGFTNPAYTWSYRPSNSQAFTTIAGATSTSYNITSAVFLSHKGLNATSVEYKLTISQPGWEDASTTVTLNYTSAANDVPVATLNKTSIILPTSEFGVINYANTNSVITVSIGGSNISYAASGPNTFNIETSVFPLNSVNIGTQTTNTFGNLSNLTAELATITYTVKTRDADGVETIIPLTQNVAKAVSGGTALVYKLISPAIVLRNQDNTSFTPTKITFGSKVGTGSLPPVNYGGRFVIQTSTDNVNYTTRYTSSVDESSYEYTLSDHGGVYVTSIKVSLYLAGGTTTLIDSEVIPVNREGQFALNLTNDNHTISTNAAGAVVSGLPVSSEAEIFFGLTKQTTGWTFAWTASAGITMAPGTAATSTVTVTAATTNGTVTVVATKTDTGETKTAVFSISRAIGGTNSYRLDLSNNNQTLRINADGVVTSPWPSTAVIVYNGSIVDTGWAFSATYSNSNITGTFNTGVTPNTFTLSAFPAVAGLDGYVDIIATKTDYATLTARLTLTKTTNAVFYEISASTNAVSKNVSGVSTPNTLTFTAYRIDGNNVRAEYSDGVITLQSATAGSGFSALSPTTTTASSASYTIPANTPFVNIKGILTVSGTAVDNETVPIVSDGAKGDTGTAYWLVTSASAIQKSISNVYNPTTLTVSGYSAVGTNSPALYAGRFKIYENGSGTASYTSAVDESSKTYTPSGTGITSIKIELYLAGGVTTKLDEQTVPMVIDGANGVNAISGVLSNESSNVPANASGTVSSFAGAATTLSIYNGSTDDSANWTYNAVKTSVTCAEAANSRTQTITSLSASVGYVDITASRSGFSSITKRFTITKAIGGADSTVPGPTGVSNYRAYIAATVASPPSSIIAATTDGAAPAGYSSSPITNLSAGQAQYQTDGTRAAGTTGVPGNTSWGTPYLSYFKVGDLSAVSVDTGTLSVTGALTVGTTGHIKGGQTGYNVGDGFFLGYSAGYKFSVGNSTNGLTWNSTNGLTITGGTLSAPGISGGTITGNSISGGTITGGAISGGTITGTSISGGVIRTAGVGSQRIAINEASNRLSFFNTAGAETIVIGGNGEIISVTSGSTVTATILGASTGTSANGLFNPGVLGSASGNGHGVIGKATSGYGGYFFNDTDATKALYVSGNATITGTMTSPNHNYNSTSSTSFYSNQIAFANAGVVKLSVEATNLVSYSTFVTNINDSQYLGNATWRWKSVYLMTAPDVLSDERVKTNIQSSVLGLNFINQLRPVSYQLISGGMEQTGEFTEEYVEEVGITKKVPIYRNVPGVRKHYGLIAQEVKSTLDLLNLGDFAGFVLEDKNDPNSQHSLRYEEFISPLIKAVQELSAKVTALENRLNS